MGDPLLPHWIDRRLPSFLLPYVRTLCGVDIDAFHGPPEALAFLADFPEIEYCAFRGGHIDRNVVRALRVLPQLRNLNFTTAYHFQAAECLPEIAQLKSLQQVSILGAPPISGLLLREFTVGRPDVAVSLGNGPVIND